MKIIYFSGTGNSLYIAKQFNCEIYSIPQLIKENIYNIEDEVVGIVVPVYYLGPPKIVSDYLEKLNIKSDYTFLILSYGGFYLDTYKKYEMIKIEIDYVNYIKMPDNFIVFDMVKAKRDESNLEMKMHVKLDLVKRDINNRVVKQDKFYFKSVVSLFGSKIVSKMLKLDSKNQDEYFYVNDECNLCSVCEKVCPANNIIIDSSVQFMSRCEQCMACIQTCPSNALKHYKQRNDERFINRNITVKEIIESNNMS